jgi:hypothetical protein
VIGTVGDRAYPLRDSIFVMTVTDRDDSRGWQLPDGPAAALTELVKDLADRDRPDRNPDDLPIVVLWGARGTESSELLRHLRRVDGWPAPRALLDGESLPALRPHAVANRLAFQLGQHVERFGRARFPRFFLGMQAVREPLDPANRNAQESRRALLRRYLRNRREGREWLHRSAGAIAVLAGLPPDRAEAFGMAVEGVLEAGRTLALLRGAGLRWYEDGLGHHVSDGADALVELSTKEFHEAHEFVDEVLCRAFVADLRSEFASGEGPIYKRQRSALVLIDNVGTEAARDFVRTLAAQRDGSGPLLVVAASHRRFPDTAARDPALWQPDDLAEASLAGWAQQRPAREGSRYYPVWVDPVDDVPATAGPREPETLAVADQRGLLPADYPVVAFARRLTAAHPAGMDMVFRVLDGHRKTAGSTRPARLDLRRLFTMVDPDTKAAGGEGKQLDDVVFDLVLGPWTEDLRGPLALMGIAVDLSDAGIAAILARENPKIGMLIREFRERDLWVSHRVVDGRADPPRLHPFARRAIAHRLARGSVAGLDWQTAHTLLRDAAAERGDEAARLYHELALGRIEPVAAALSGHFDPEDPRGWYRLLLRVTRAPVARPDRSDDAHAHLGELCADADPAAVVTGELLAALQLHTDPLGDPRHDMCGLVTAALGDLSRKARTGKAYLLGKSKDFDDCWSQWHPR